MKKNSFLVKAVLMSMLTAVTFSFASCSDDDLVENNSQNPVASQSGGNANVEPYGLCYYDFEGSDDVTILNADTTEISVKKALAEKLGISTFVNHPLGIWQAEARLPFARKVVAENLVGDTYILEVVPATVAELLGETDVKLNTSIYYNEKAEVPATRAGMAKTSLTAAQHTDENNIVHPCVIHLTDPYGYDADGHHPGEQPKAATRANSDGEYEYYTAKELAKSNTRSSTRRNIISAQTNIKFNHRFGFGEGKSDTINFSGNIPIDFDLNYFLTFDTKLGWDTYHPTYEVNYFDAGIDGSLKFSPEAYLSFSKSLELPDDMKKVKLYSFSGYSFTFVVGCVPVLISLDPSLYLKFDAGVAGSAKVGFKYEYENEFRAGCCYDHGRWENISYFKEIKNQFEFVKPEIEFKAEASAGLFLGVDVVFYEVAGPELGIGPQLSAEASMKIKPLDKEMTFDANCDLRVKAFAGAKVKVLGWELAEWSSEFDLAGPWTLFSTSKTASIHVPEVQKNAQQFGDFISNFLKAAKQNGHPNIEELYYEFEFAQTLAGLTEDEVKDHFYREWTQKYGKLDANNAKVCDEVAKFLEEWHVVLHSNYDDFLLLKQANELIDAWKQIPDFKRCSWDCMLVAYTEFAKQFKNRTGHYPTMSDSDVREAYKYVADVMFGRK